MDSEPQTDRVLQLQLRARELEDLEGVIVRAFDDRLAEWIHKFIEALETHRANQRAHHFGIFIEYEPAIEDEPENAWLGINHGDNREVIKLYWRPQPVYVCGPRQICWDIDANQPATEGLCPRCKGAAEERKED